MDRVRNEGLGIDKALVGFQEMARIAEMRANGEIIPSKTMVEFIERDMGASLWSKQREIAESIDAHPRTAVRSAHSCGKSYLAARVALAYSEMHPHSIVVTTAPTSRQVRNVLWRNMRSAYRASKVRMKGRMLTERYDIAEDWYAIGFKGSDNNSDAVQGFHCFDEEHEILTKRGWLGIDDITEDDEVLSAPMGGGNAEWMPVTSVHRYDHDGYLNELNSRSVSFAVTDNHRFPAKQATRPSSAPYRLRQYSDLPKDVKIWRSTGWEGVPIEVPEAFAKYGLNEEAFAELVGFWIGDGGVRPRGDGYTPEVIFYQSKEDGGYLAGMLSPFSVFYGRDYTAFSDRSIVEWLLENVGALQVERVIPRMLLDAPAHVLEAFRRGFWAAEGDSHEYGQVYNSNRLLMDQIQEITIKLGNPGTIGVNTPAGLDREICGVKTKSNYDCLTLRWCAPKKGDGYTFSKGDVRRTRHVGRVWCISTPYQTFYTRRRGRVFLSGNSSDLLVIVDEAAGVSESVMEGLEAILTGANSRLLLIGNPTSMSGTFRRAFHEDRELYNLITISAYDTPNFTTFGITREDIEDGSWSGKVTGSYPYPGLVDPGWVERQVMRHGVDSAFVQSRVDAVFPVDDDSVLISLADIDVAMSTREDPAEDEKKYVGIDVASTGGDETCLVFRQGQAETYFDAWQGFDLMEGVGKVRELLRVRGYEDAEIRVDAIGLGEGFASRLSELGYDVVMVKVSESSSDKSAWRNFRHEAWWQLKELYRERLIWCSSSHEFDPQMISQLADIRMKYGSTYTKPEIEPKDMTKKRTGRSPDRAEAQMLAFCVVPPKARKKKYRVPTKAAMVYGKTQGWGIPLD